MDKRRKNIGEILMFTRFSQKCKNIIFISCENGKLNVFSEAIKQYKFLFRTNNFKIISDKLQSLQKVLTKDIFYCTVIE